MTKKDLYFFTIAKNVSVKSNFKRIKIGCIAVWKKKYVISTGVNSYKTHPLQRLYNRYRWNIDVSASPHCIHAEVQALVNLRRKFDFSNVVLYIYRQHGDGSLAMCRPCNSCLQLIKDFKIKRIYYTTNCGYASEILVQ